MVFKIVYFVGFLTPFALGALTCPKLDEGAIGHCAMMCSKDSECGDGEMCCSNGCGHDCVKAVETDERPPTEGLVCPKPKKGLFGHCAEMCMTDSECADDELCCSNGCGHDCVKAVEPEKKKPLLVCPNTVGMIGHCGMFCVEDSECGDGELCCSNGCGFDCMKAVESLIQTEEDKKSDVEEDKLEDKSKDVWLSDLACPKLKEGMVGHCAHMCFGDSECGEGELCCSNGCGMQCTKATKGSGKKRTPPPTESEEGETGSGDEPTSGEDSSDKRARKPDSKPRRPVSSLKCPKVDDSMVGLCAEMCTFDQECGEGELCCSNGCGHQCTKAVKKEPKPGMCLGSKKQKCRRRCPEKTCGEDECLMRNDNCCDLTCEKVEIEKPVDKPKMCPASKQQFCFKMCPQVSCGEDECLMRNDNCCDLTCEKVEKPVVEPEMCPASKLQVCRKMCPQVSCGEDECLMRNDNCCDLTCEKVEKPVFKPTMCPASKLQSCFMMCPLVLCGEDECLMRNDRCCDLTCEKLKEKPEEPETCEWESSVCDPKNDQCGKGYRCDPKACVPSVCNCEIMDGKPMFMCTADCNPGCVKDDSAALCNEDRHCGFLGQCSGGRCSLKSDVTFADVQYDCASAHGDLACRTSGCGKKADKKGKCVPKSVEKISCKTIGDNEGLCDLLKCKFKKGRCGGKSRLE